MTAYNFENPEMLGSVKSLNLVITEVLAFKRELGLREGDEARPSKNLQAFLFEEIRDLAESCYHRGFSEGRVRGHRESSNRAAALRNAPRQVTSFKIATPIATARKRRTIGPGFKIATPKRPTTQRRRNRR